jgi:hypothetical protein
MESSNTTFFRFLDLPPEVRNMIYKELLAVNETIYILRAKGWLCSCGHYDTSCAFHALMPNRPDHWLAILYVNWQIHIEGSSILYHENHFSMAIGALQWPDILELFLKSIGKLNTRNLSYLTIKFPEISTSEHGKTPLLTIKDGLDELRLVQKTLINLRRLEMFIHKEVLFDQQKVKDSSTLNHTAPDDVQRFLTKMDICMKSIPTLSQITVINAWEPFYDPIIRTMQGFGWNVLVIRNRGEELWKIDIARKLMRNRTRRCRGRR